MKKNAMILGTAKTLAKHLTKLVVLLMIFSIGFTACKKDEPPYSDAEIQGMVDLIKELTKGNDTIKKNLLTFDTLDFTVFSNQQWARLHESHDKNIKVVMPDGSVTVGLDVHIQTLSWLFLHAPDTRIKQHPIKFGSGKYTAVTGVMEGTFTKPMFLQNGTTVPPTGKSFKLPMVTIGIWENGVMVEEQLYYDNQSYFKQMGL